MVAVSTKTFLVITTVFAFGATSVNIAQARQQPPEKVQQSTIIVTGKPLTKEELREQASTFVRSATVIPDEGQFARRLDPICPAVSGIDPQLAQRVVAKIKSVAQATGVPVAKANCSANLLVNFTNDVDDFFKRTRKTRPGLFGALRPHERTALFDSKLPVRWFYGTEARAGDNTQIQKSVGNPGYAVGTGGQGSGEAGPGSSSVGSTDLPTPNRGATAIKSSSLIDSNLVVSLSTAVVVVDAQNASGYALESVAAHAAMVSLAQIKLTADFSAYPSILAIYAGGKARDEAPRDLTEWDYAYLRALYKVQPNRTARVQRTRIFGDMVKSLGK